MTSYYLVSTKYGWELLLGKYPFTLANYLVNSREWRGNYKIIRNDLYLLKIIKKVLDKV
jgi:hypothetical protein